MLESFRRPVAEFACRSVTDTAAASCA